MTPIRATFMLMIFLGAVALGAVACGKKGPPVPPDIPTGAGKKLEPLEIPEDTGERLFEMYGDKTPEPEKAVPETTPEPAADSEGPTENAEEEPS
jgi:hypothetical protein